MIGTHCDTAEPAMVDVQRLARVPIDKQVCTKVTPDYRKVTEYCVIVISVRYHSA